MDATFRQFAEEGGALRQLEPQWNTVMIAASIAISLLGTFTSTQLMVQARMSQHFSGALIWTMLSCLVFGFCSIWSLHEVAMLACELDLPIGIDVGLTILSSILAVAFTFAALASDLLWDRYAYGPQKRRRMRRSRRGRSGPVKGLPSTRRESEGSEPLLKPSEEEDEEERLPDEIVELSSRTSLLQRVSLEANGTATFDADSRPGSPVQVKTAPTVEPTHRLLNSPLVSQPVAESPKKAPKDRAESVLSDGAGSHMERTSSDRSGSRHSSTYTESNNSSFGVGNLMSIKPYRESSVTAKNAFVATGKILYAGSTRKNVIKSFLWSLAITSMHYVGIAALLIPRGYFTLSPPLVVLSAAISWVVCLVGCILMARMETHLGQQFLFTVVATTGVAAMHFTGMSAARFWSDAPPSERRGYPPALAVAVASIAITTCILANGLLAHSATMSRNKLAEIVYTRRKLWMAIAQKENAESATAAKSDFIASASHEIRTPLHHLQGYSDLLSRTELTEEGRMLLQAIQRATKTLSLITNNVLDWSRLERDGETVCRPIALDIRTICESIICLLPNRDDESEVELMVVVAPDVPHSLFLDETYVHRILMNLLSNAIKFTSSGYILLLIEMKNNKLIARVKDTGCGVPVSFLPQLFEPFKQAQTRGSQRGTGLGLSIVKQLLQKMQGTIDVESIHHESEDEGSERTGSTFTVTIPVQRSTSPQDEPPSAKVTPRIAIFHGGNKQSLEGLRQAWEKFDYGVVVAQEYSALSDLSSYKYIWADLPSLQQQSLLHQLLSHDQSLVLVPYDSQTALLEVPGLLSKSHIIPIQKPLIWHAIKQSIADAGQHSKKAPLARTVRFASRVDVVEANGVKEKQPEQRSTAKDHVVLLVEDNQINRKLGSKMLTSLGYQVLFAEDGQDAIEQIIKHDKMVDVILMDQSMPRKDGVAATREIREMEQNGVLSRRRPIIAVTAVVSAQAQALCKEAGTDDFLAKPLSLRKLEQTLAAHLSLE